jgi:DNA-binding Lrp family transcriptional regulator
MNVFGKDKIRYKLIVETYNLTNGNTRAGIDLEELGNELQIDENEIENAYYYLKDEGYIEPCGMGYAISITHYGIKLVESFLRKIDFKENKEFNSTELYQLKIVLDEIKEQIMKLQLGQEVIYNQIDEAYEKSKEVTKLDWKEYFESQIKDWATQKIIDNTTQLIMQSILIGLKVNL